MAFHRHRCGINRPLGFEHDLMLTLPARSGPVIEPGRTMRLFFFRGPGSDFSERDRAVLTLMRPHLYEAYLDAERRRHLVPRLTPRHWELLHLLAAGHTNTQIARRLGVTEGTVRIHLENIYERRGVSSRTAAVTRTFPDRAASHANPSSPRRATFVPEQAGNYGRQRSSTGSTTGLRPGHVQVDPLPETTF
jgi:DNA-binding CsgD family transcriptional regulator